MPPTVMPLHGFNTVEFNYLKSVVAKRATTGVSRTAAEDSKILLVSRVVPANRKYCNRIY